MTPEDIEIIQKERARSDVEIERIISILKHLRDIREHESRYIHAHGVIEDVVAELTHIKWCAVYAMSRGERGAQYAAKRLNTGVDNVRRMIGAFNAILREESSNGRA